MGCDTLAKGQDPGHGATIVPVTTFILLILWLGGTQGPRGGLRVEDSRTLWSPSELSTALEAYVCSAGFSSRLPVEKCLPGRESSPTLPHSALCLSNLNNCTLAHV